MAHIAIISSSVRTGRNSHRVAVYFQDYLTKNKLSSAEILDLKAYDFTLFDERMKYQQNPSDKMLDFQQRIKSSDGVIIVTPEYNGGYPAALKNVIDLLYDEWFRKPIGLVAVSDGDFGGTQVITSLQFTLWKMRAWVTPARFHVQRVDKAFNESGEPAEPDVMNKRAKSFLAELFWCVEAHNRMKDYQPDHHH